MKRGIVVALVAVALASCTSPPPPERDKVFGPVLAAATNRAFQTHQDLKIASVTAFSWKKLYMIKPDQSPDHINGLLGFHWATDYSDQTNSYCLLVFVSGTTVTHSLLFPRYQGDCVGLAEGPYDPQHAVFRVTSSAKTTGGQPFLKLVDVS